ncbi:MAG: T9SS type A sorting domain-containing protein [Paludibacter sp.]
MAGGWSGNQTSWTEGDGSQAAPYLIQSAEQLAYLAQQVNTGNSFENKYFRLITDLDLGGTETPDNAWNGQRWTPIGTPEAPFSGHFNGAGHTIEKMYIFAPFDDYKSLFGVIANATIDSINIGKSFVQANDYLGGVCGKAISSAIVACTNQATLNGNMYVGGICGYTGQSVINSCINLASTKNTGYYTGGITGFVSSKSSVTSCVNSGSVLGYVHYVGGICGYAEYNCSVDKCINNNTVAGRFYYIGGICGAAFNNTVISNCVYDKQICTVGGINGMDLSGSAVGLSTTEMLSSSLATQLSNGDFTFSTGIYPIPTKTAGTVVAALSASPVVLTAGESGLYVLSSFQVSTSANIAWSSSDNNVIAIDNTDATVYYTDEKNSFATLTGTLAGATKTILVSVGNRGTSYRPLTIDNLSDFKNLSNVVNVSGSEPVIYKGVTMVNGFKGVYFTLTSDIDFGGVQAVAGSWRGISWKPVGSNSFRFKGNFNGQNHTLSNLYINDVSTEASQVYLGLFGFVDEAIIDSIYISSGAIKGINYLGGVCGQAANSKIRACGNNSTLTGKAFMGGMCGFADATIIEGCTNSGSIHGSMNCIGGIAGRAYRSTISNTINTSSVSGSGSTGAICGESQLSSVLNCFYDKQLCPKGGIAGVDIAGQAVGKLTTEMKGSALSNALGASATWKFNDNYYPGLKTADATDAAVVNSTPVFLSANESSQSVKSSFALGGTTNGVNWLSSDPSVVSISGGNATVNYDAAALKSVILTAKLNSASKNIEFIVGEIGSKAMPLTVDSLADLRTLRDAVNQQRGVTGYKGILINNGFSGLYFKLTRDIDFLAADTLENWQPIGTNNSIFKGNFNGAGHKVSSLYINRQQTAQGLFGVIQNASLDSINISGASVTGLNYVGGLAGYVLNSKVNLCSYKGTVTSSNSAGGLCGYVYSSTIQKSTHTGTVAGAGTVGGICSSAPSSTISYCLNAGNVNGTGERVGGISGDIASAAKIQFCTNTAAVKGSSNYVGGLCGYASSTSNISTSSNAGIVTGGGYTIGGISGYTENSSMNACINTGNVAGSSNVGGICGFGNNSTVSNCYYDKQLCPVALAVAHVNGGAVTTTEAKLTSEIISSSLQPALGTSNWVFTTGLYPGIAGTETTDIAAVAVAPVTLNAPDENNFETIGSVKSDFAVANGNSVQWSSADNTIVRINNTIAGVYQPTKDSVVLISASKNGVSKFIDLKVLKSTSTGLSGMKLAGIEVYPNPATDYLTVRLGNEKTDRIAIYNSCGAVVREITPNENELIMIKLSDLKPAMYLIKIGKKVTRFIKK